MTQKPYLEALTNQTRKYGKGRTKIANGGMPHDFNKVVLNHAGVNFSSAYVTMVRQGKRSNKKIHEAINFVLKNKIFA